MKTLVYHGPRTLTLEESTKPQPGPDEALLRVRAVGICGSEIEGYLGYNSLRVPPLVMGHEFAGEVVALGPTEQADAPEVGQVVTVNPLISCGACVFCHADLAHLCPQRKLIGAHQPGAFADYVRVPLSAIVPLPESLDPILGALTEPFAVALHGVELARITSEQGVVVWGAGSIGLLTICAARLKTPAHIIAVDTNPVRLNAARQVGATAVFDAHEENVVGSIRSLLANVARTVVLDAVGRSSTRQASLAAAGPGGSVILLGLHDKETSFDIQAVIRSEVALQGSYGYTMTDIRRAVALLQDDEVPTSLWLDVRPLSAGPDSFAELVDSPGAATKIVLVP